MNLGIRKTVIAESPPLANGKTEYDELMKRLLSLKRPIVRSLRKYAKSRAVREEAFYEALVDRCIKGKTFEPESERAYLAGIAKNKLIAKYRKEKLLKISSVDPIGVLDRVGMDLSRIALPAYMLHCLENLEHRAPNWFAVIKWRVMHGLTCSETLEKIGMNVQEDTLRQWKKRGIDALRNCADLMG